MADTGQQSTRRVYQGMGMDRRKNNGEECRLCNGMAVRSDENLFFNRVLGSVAEVGVNVWKGDSGNH